MKIVSYIPIALLAVLMLFGYQYASKQATTMRLLVDARSGLGSEPGGLTLVNKNLETEAATIAKRRAEALKKNQEVQAMTQKSLEDMEAVRRVADGHKAEMERLQARMEELESRQAELAAERDKIVAQIHQIPGLEDGDLENAVSLMEEKLKEGSDELAELQKNLEEQKAKREELTKTVSELTVDLKNKKEANDRFLDAYRKNGEEYSIAAVDPQWHFVIFKAGEDSGFFPGDTTPLIVQRNGVSITTLRVVSVSGGQVVAEYDEKTLPQGLQPEVGDQVFRKVPMGS